MRLSLLTTLVLVSQATGRLSTPPPSRRQAGGSTPTNGSYAPGITFAPCPDVKPFQPVNASLGLQCANFSVPMVDSDPFGAQVMLGVVKLPAKGGAPRVGNLFINPGGPGSPASTMVVNIARGALPFGDTTLAQFDIIGMDPRGVGLSSPQRCDPNIGNSPSNFNAITPDGFQALSDYYKALGESCRFMTGPLFDNMDTVAVAKDMERVRVALGNEPLNYFGQSYGAQLGHQYAALFPQNVRAMALDGILQHSGTYAANILIQTTSLDQTMQAFFDECRIHPISICGVPSNSTGPLVDLRKAWETAIGMTDAGTLRAPGCDGTPKTGCYPQVTVSSMLGTARSLLQVPTLQRRLANGILAAAAGNGSLFADKFLSGDVFTDSGAYAIQNVQCQDGWFVAATSPEQVQGIALQTRTFTVTPGMGEFWDRVIGCTGYPVKVTNPRARLGVTGLKNPVLLVHSRYDPATSLVYAQGMAEEIEGSVLLVRDGISHTSYFLAGETAQAVDTYLVNLTTPALGTVLFG